MPYGKYVGVPIDQIPGPAPMASSVVVGGNGKPLSTQSVSNASSLQKIIDSGVPLTGGNSAGLVDTSAVNMGSALASLGNNLSTNFQGLFDLIKENTAFNNAWSAAQAQKQMDFQTQSNQIAMDFNAAEAAKNRDWQEMMSNTAHQREMADLKAAGLNPVLTATGGNGAAVTSGSAASGVTSSGAQADADQSANTALAAIYGSLINAQTSMYNANLSARTNLQMAQMQQEASMYGAQLASEASKYAAGTNYAASVYGYDNQAQMQREKLDYDSTHPNSAWQAVNTILDQVFGEKQGSTSAKQSGISSAFEWLKNAHEARKQN